MDLSILKKKDIYSLMLFILYKLKDLPEFITLSELVYILDIDNFLKLCEYFGGLTISIPTITEVQSLIYSLTLYQLIDIEGKSMKDAVQLINLPADQDIETIKQNYFKISKTIENYSFTTE